MSRRDKFPSASALSLCSARTQVLASLFGLKSHRGRRRITLQARTLATAARYGVGVRTINGWLRSLKVGGVQALLPRRRSDAGMPRKVTRSALEFFCERLKKNPKISVARVICDYEHERKRRPALPDLSRDTVRVWVGRLRWHPFWEEVRQRNEKNTSEFLPRAASR